MGTAASKKSKGRRLQNAVVLKFRELFNGILVKGDIMPAIMGTSGVDTVLSPSAKNIIAFDIECKNQEKLIGAALTNAIEQCESNTEGGRIPLLIFKKNDEPERVIIKLNDFLNLIYPNRNVSFSMTELQNILIEIEKLKQFIIERATNDNK